MTVLTLWPTLKYVIFNICLHNLGMRNHFSLLFFFYHEHLPSYLCCITLLLLHFSRVLSKLLQEALHQSTKCAVSQQ